MYTDKCVELYLHWIGWPYYHCIGLESNVGS